MKNYLLNNYNLSPFQLFQSLFLSEYGLRHLAQARKQNQYKWGHRLIAVIELCPVIGIIASMIERLVAYCLQPYPIKPRNWLFVGTQNGCDGRVSIAKVESIRAKLEARHSSGIKFNQKKIANYLAGGTCTAMSLEFLDEYFKSKKTCINKTDDQSKGLAEYIIQFGQKFSSSSKEMRDLQAAYNTIEVISPLDEKIDYAKNKVQSLVNFHSFVIDHSSDEIGIDQLKNESELMQKINALPEGVFFVRILKPSKNEKLEEKGHSLVYIKEKGLNLLYDPNFGARQLSPSDEARFLFKSFKSCFSYFQTNQARFYRLQPSI